MSQDNKGIRYVHLKGVKKGELVRIVRSGGSGKRVYIRGDYDRSSRAYSLQAFDDINDERFLKGARLVAIGFEF
jgi:hypothetical protein